MFEIMGTPSQSFKNCLLCSHDHLEIPSWVKLSYYLVNIAESFRVSLPLPPNKLLDLLRFPLFEVLLSSNPRKR